MTIYENCACCGTNLDRFLQPIILSIVKKAPCTGYAIVKQIAEYSTFKGNGPDPTGVYRYLKIMSNRKMLQRRAEGEKELYAITDEGEHCLGQWMETLAEYAGQIETLRSELTAS